MPVEVGIWKLGDRPERINFTRMSDEALLERTLVNDLSIISSDLLLLGHQVVTDHGGRLDLLAINADGDLAVIELKRDKTPREVVAQVLDYAAWARRLSYDDIAEIFASQHPGRAFEADFDEKFGSAPPDELNRAQRLMVVATELDARTERIIDYLADGYGVPINAVFFRVFRDGEREYLTRSWLLSPEEVEERGPSSTRRKQQPWSGDYYVSLGEGQHRDWDDCRRYGFVSAGGGRWYSKTLEMLSPGNRIFVHIPSRGYVGVGEVTQQVVRVSGFTVEVDGRATPLLEAPIQAPMMDEHVGDEECEERVVGVRWIKEVGREQAYWEKGMFANQNSVCKLRQRFTLERLRAHFGLDD